jgi:dihydroorotate dehydrogenase electron transfer subunit
VFDCDGGTVSFLYKAVGKGTGVFSALRKGDGISATGPLGNSFPGVTGKIGLVGGGAGIAPLYLAAKQLKQLKEINQINQIKKFGKSENNGSKADIIVDIYLGFSEAAFLTEEYKNAADTLVTDVGGFITDKIDPCGYDHIMACGPEPMMKALYEKCKTGAEEKLYVSMESRMACGIGACLVCNCKTAGGNRKICKDGPVFKGAEVFGS